MSKDEAIKAADDRTRQLREAIEYDIRNKREKLNATIPASAWHHFRHKPFASDWRKYDG